MDYGNIIWSSLKKTSLKRELLKEGWGVCVCVGGGEEEADGGGGTGGGVYRDAIQADRRAGVIFLVSAKRLKLKRNYFSEV